MARELINRDKLALAIDLDSIAVTEGTFAGIEIRSGAVVAPASGNTPIGGTTLPCTQRYYAKSALFSLTGGRAVLNLQYYSGIVFCPAVCPSMGQTV